MWLTKNDLILCATARGAGILQGFDLTLPSDPEAEMESALPRLIDQGMLEPITGGDFELRFSPLGQLMIDLISKPWIWMQIDNQKSGVLRRIYIRDAFYLCVDEVSGDLNLLLLPSIPLLIGAYAEALEGIRSPVWQGSPDELQNSTDLVPYLQIMGFRCGKELLMSVCDDGRSCTICSGNTDYQVYTEETLTNKLSMWLLQGLKEGVEINGQ